MQFRADIQGLRAIAVLGVFLFHLGVASVPGGYVGVDIFFVISGFLITGIIAKDIRAGRFSFAEFYNRRMKRILPAAQIVGLVTFAAGCFLLLPTSLLQLVRSLVASSLFVSNIYFWKETTGYFGTSSEELPLLHNWSLSVEEQFYMFWPLALFFLLRPAGNKRLVFAIAAIIIGSFALGELLLDDRATASYFLLPTRAGEFLIGAMLVFLPEMRRDKQSVNEVLAIIGLVLLLASNFLLQRYSRFPGINAIWPCVGTALVIQTGRGCDTFVKSLLSFRPLVFIGTISYSLYLWHWPPVAFLHYFGIQLTVIYQLGLFVLVVALGYLSWRFIEEKVRHVKWPLSRTVFAFVVPLVALQFAAAMTVQAERPAFRGLAEFIPMRSGCPEGMSGQDYPARCLLGDQKSAPTFVLWGDSFAGSLMDAIDQAAGRDRASGYNLTLSMCPSIDGVVWNDPQLMPYKDFAADCRDFDKRTYDFILKSPDVHTVVLTSNYFWYLTARNPEGKPILNTERQGASIADEYRMMLERLAAANKRIIVIMPHPSDKDQYYAALRRAYAFGSMDSLAIAEPKEHWDTISPMIESLPPQIEVDRIYPSRMMCEQGHCLVFDKDGDLFLSDGAHVTPKMAIDIVAKFPRDWEHRKTVHDRTESADSSPSMDSDKRPGPTSIRDQHG